MIFRKETPKAIYKGDPLWTVVLSQLKTQALCLAPYFRGGADSAADSALGYEALETYLSQIEDSYDLTRLLFLKKDNLRQVSFAQIAEDVSESFARRFGILNRAPVTILVDDKLPAVQTYPTTAMRVVDCLVRAAHRLVSDQGSTVAITLLPSSKGSNELAKISFRCLGLSFGLDAKRLQESLAKFRDGKYAHCINDLGLDLCAALHLASQLTANTEFRISKDTALGIEIEMEFPLATAGKSESGIGFNEYAFISESQEMALAIKGIANFHRLSVRQLSVSDVSSLQQQTDLRLVYDLSGTVGISAAGSFQAALPKPGVLPKNTVFLLPNLDLRLIAELSSAGYSHFISKPLVSSRLLKALAGVDNSASTSGVTKVSDAKALRVLVVDDTETARIVMRDHLEARGHQVVEAADGTEFVDLIQRGEQFDIVFCDVTMVHIDGPAAVKMVREIEVDGRKPLPIVMVTAYSAVEAANAAPIAGVDAILQKPIRGREIDRMLEEFCCLISEPVVETKVVAGRGSIGIDELHARCSGKTKTMVRLLDSFITTADSLLPKLSDDYALEDLKTLAKTLHTVKGLLREIAAIEGAKALESYEVKLKEQNSLTPEDLAAVREWLGISASAAVEAKKKLVAAI